MSRSILTAAALAGVLLVVSTGCKGDGKTAEVPAIEIEPGLSYVDSLVGTGDALKPLSQPVRDALRAAGIRAEPMATGAAARTYNILVGERRRVAAALLAAA